LRGGRGFSSSFKTGHRPRRIHQADPSPWAGTPPAWRIMA